MPKISKPLSDKEIKALKPTGKRRKIALGNGLYIFIENTGKKFFVFLFTSKVDKKRKMIVLGEYPFLSLKDAREKSFKFQSDLLSGIDVKLKNSLDKNATFETIANRYLDIKSQNVSKDYTQKERRNLQLHILPYIGKADIRNIKEVEIIEVLKKLEKGAKFETIKRLFSLLNQIYKSAYHLTPNIMQNINFKYTFKQSKVKNFPTITNIDEIKILLENINNYNGDIRTKYALKISILTALRPLNVRMLKWDQIDFKNGLLNISADFMKTKQSFTLPLSKQALNLLSEFKNFDFCGEFVFSSNYTKNRPMSENTINLALRRMGYGKDEIVAHGFRAMFSTICNEFIEDHGLGFDIIEKCLSHKDKNAVRSAYNRAKNLTQMKNLMQWYADFLENLTKIS